jgi:hypothetical protein
MTGATNRSHQRLVLSAVEVRFEVSRFSASVSSYSNEFFAELRDRDDVFAYRVQDKLLSFPLKDDAEVPDRSETLPVLDHLHALGALLQHRLSDVLAQLELRRRRRPNARLRRVNRADDLVARTFAALKKHPPLELEGFHKYLRTEFEVRVIEGDGHRPMLVIAIRSERHYEIDGTAHDLLEQGLDLRGLEALSTDRSLADRHLGIVVDSLARQLVIRTEHGERSVDAKECLIAPSMQTFTSVFSQALRTDWHRYQAAERRLVAQTTSGRGYTEHLRRTCDYLIRRGSVEIAPGVRCVFEGPITVGFGPSGAARILDPVEYCFSADQSKRHQYPALGLDQFGPFDSQTFDKKRPRVLVVAPSQQQGDVETFLRRLRDGMQVERVDRFSRGFIGTYRLSKLDLEWVLVPLPPDGARNVGARYVEALKEKFDPDNPPDVALVVLRELDAFSPDDNAYLASKAYLLSQGVPVQQVRLPTLRQHPRGLAYVLENFAVGLYAKLGGAPWTVVPTMPMAEEIVIGVGVAESGGRDARTRYAGITTVFRSDGSYVMGAASDRCELSEFPDVLIAFVQRTLRRLITDRGWSAGDYVRLVFHSHQPLRKTDIFRLVDRAVAELGSAIHFQTAFLTVRRDHPFKVVDPNENGRERGGVKLIEGGYGKKLVGVHVPARGTVIELGQSRQLLCVTGASLVKREGEPVPDPLLIELHPASTYRDLDSLVRQVFHFTGLSWRSMLPIAEPVTIYYSHLIASALMKLGDVPGWKDSHLDTKLRRSRWFL